MAFIGLASVRLYRAKRMLHLLYGKRPEPAVGNGGTVLTCP